MARSVSANSTTYGAVNDVARTQAVTLNAYASSTGDGDTRLDLFTYWGYSANPSTNSNDHCGDSTPTTWWGGRGINVNCDTTWYWQARGRFYNVLVLVETKFQGGSFAKQSWAVTPTLDDAPTLSGETSSAVTVGSGGVDSFTPATNETAVDLILQYKLSSDSVWSDWSTLNADVTGYTDTAITSDTVTGLTADTSYDFRYKLDRTGTANSTTLYYSATSTTSTLPDAPTVTTDAASNVTAGVSGTPNDGTAKLNGTIDHNKEYPTGDLEYRFVWDTTPTGGSYSNTQSWQTSYSPATEELAVNHSISSLAESTEYGYRLEIRWDGGGSTDNGSEVTFTVPADPAAEAAQEALMIVYEYDAIQGEDKTVYFSFRDVATSSSDRFLSDAVTNILAAADGGGDVLIYIDGTLKATNSGKPDNNITRVGSTSLFSLTLDGSSELTGEDVIVQFVDAGGPVFRDFQIHVRTKIKTSQLRCDASQGLTNSSGFVATGVGTGHGISAVAGASGMDIDGVIGEHVLESGTAQAGGASTITLRAAASGTADLFNGQIILIHTGTGAGQARVITDYNTSQVATVHKAWATNPSSDSEYVIIPGPDVWQIPAGGELTALPTKTDSFEKLLMFLFQRFMYKRTQTATSFKMYKDDGTEIFNGSVDDDGTTQTHNELSAS